MLLSTTSQTYSDTYVIDNQDVPACENCGTYQHSSETCDKPTFKVHISCANCHSNNHEVWECEEPYRGGQNLNINAPIEHAGSEFHKAQIPQKCSLSHTTSPLAPTLRHFSSPHLLAIELIEWGKDMEKWAKSFQSWAIQASEIIKISGEVYFRIDEGGFGVSLDLPDTPEFTEKVMHAMYTARLRSEKEISESNTHPRSSATADTSSFFITSERPYGLVGERSVEGLIAGQLGSSSVDNGVAIDTLNPIFNTRRPCGGRAVSLQVFASSLNVQSADLISYRVMLYLAGLQRLQLRRDLRLQKFPKHPRLQRLQRLQELQELQGRQGRQQRKPKPQSPLR